MVIPNEIGKFYYNIKSDAANKMKWKKQNKNKFDLRIKPAFHFSIPLHGGSNLGCYFTSNQMVQNSP